MKFIRKKKKKKKKQYKSSKIRKYMIKKKKKNDGVPLKGYVVCKLASCSCKNRRVSRRCRPGP